MHSPVSTYPSLNINQSTQEKATTKTWLLEDKWDYVYVTMVVRYRSSIRIWGIVYLHNLEAKVAWCWHVRFRIQINGTVLWSHFQNSEGSGLKKLHNLFLYNKTKREASCMMKKVTVKEIFFLSEQAARRNSLKSQKNISFERKKVRWILGINKRSTKKFAAIKIIDCIYGNQQGCRQIFTNTCGG